MLKLDRLSSCRLLHLTERLHVLAAQVDQPEHDDLKDGEERGDQEQAVDVERQRDGLLGLERAVEALEWVLWRRKTVEKHSSSLGDRMMINYQAVVGEDDSSLHEQQDEDVLQMLELTRLSDLLFGKETAS